MRDTFRNFCIIISMRAQMTYHPFIYPSIQPSSIAASKTIVTPDGSGSRDSGQQHLRFEESSVANS